MKAAKVAQKTWFDRYFSSLVSVLNNKFNPNSPRTIRELLDVVFNNLYVKDDGNKGQKIYYASVGDNSTAKNYPCFPSTASLNNQGGIIGLMHLGVQYFNIALRDIPSQTQNVCYYLNQFYRFDILEDFLNKYGQSQDKANFSYVFDIRSSLLANFKEINQLMNSKVTNCTGLIKLLSIRDGKWNGLF